MKKNRFWLLVLFVFLVAPLFAREFRDLRREIDRALKDDQMTSSQKNNLIRQLSQFQTADAVNVCFNIIEMPDRATQRFEREKQAITDRLDKLYNELQQLIQAINQQGSYTQAQGNRVNELQRQIKEISEKEIPAIEDKIRTSTEVKNAALWVLTRMESDEARDEMLKGLTSSKWKIVFACVDAFRAQKWKGAFDEIAALYPVSGRPHREAQVRAAAILALTEIDALSAKDIFINALDDDNWLVQSNAVKALAEIADKDCIEPLINLLAKQETGRLKWDIIIILKNITGQDFRDNISAWRSWWAANKDRFEAKKKGADALQDDKDEGSHETGAFYGIPIASDSPIFIIDQSGSMQAAADTNIGQKQAQEYLRNNPGATAIPPIPPPPGYKSRWQVLQDELEKSIEELNERVATFNIIWYSTGIEVYSDTMVRANRANKRRAIAEIKKRQADGMTNIHDALKRAFEIATGQKAGSGGSVWTRDKGELHSDTFFFMTDGYPTEGPVTDMNQLIKLVDEWNTNLGIKIHSIGVGVDERYTSYDFLKTLAMRNNGKLVLHNTEKKDKDK